MTAQPLPLSSQHRRPRVGRAGFTLVELMVAVTGGLFVAIMVFVLARDGARFYQREARVLKDDKVSGADWNSLRKTK